MTVRRMLGGMDRAIRVGVRALPPVVADGVRGWLRRDLRFVPVDGGMPADVVVLDPSYEGASVAPGERAVAFVPVSAAEAEGVTAYGIKAVVSQSRHRRHLIEALVEVAVGDRLAGPSIRLSDRERMALVWWLRSMTKASVARRMGISPHTVDMYIKRIRAKYAAVGYSLPTKADLLVRAIEDGLVGPEDVLTGPVTG
jgi:two-component system nitrate/nitrite response regulator NarL